MSKFLPIGERLREERERLGYNQTDFAAVAKVGRKTQFNYESGERVPDGAYLAALASVGADINYILTGRRAAPAPTPRTDEEAGLLEWFRGLDKPTRKAFRLFASGLRPADSMVVNQHINGDVNGGHVSAGGVVNYGRRHDDE